MKSILLVVLFSMYSFGALAQWEPEKLFCDVTEPFNTYTFDPGYSSWSVEYAVDAPAVDVVSRAVKFESVTSADLDGLFGSQYRVVDTKTGVVYAELTLDYQGSNGMADTSYPFSAKIGQHFAGCYSTSMPKADMYDSILLLKESN